MSDCNELLIYAQVRDEVITVHYVAKVNVQVNDQVVFNNCKITVS